MPLIMVLERRGDCPILDPLELLRLAGVRVDGDVTDVTDDFGVAFAFAFAFVDALLCVDNGFLYADFASSRGDVRAVVVFNAIFLTVFVDVALFSDERELRKLVRELLRSTSRLCCIVFEFESDFFSELVRFGIIVLRTDEVLAEFEARNERLRSKLWRLRSSRFCTVDFGMIRRLNGVSVPLIPDAVLVNFGSGLLSV